MLLAALVLFLLWQQMFICTSGSVSLPLCQNWRGCKHYISIAVIFLLRFYNETLSWQVRLSVGNLDQSRCVHLVDCFSLLNDFASSSLLLWFPMSSTFLLKHVYLPYVFVCGCFFLSILCFSPKTCWKACLGCYENTEPCSCCVSCFMKSINYKTGGVVFMHCWSVLK